MKNALLILFIALLSACSKKTYTADSNKLVHQLKNSSDSLVNKASLTTDKTVTLINRSIDTNIIITGKALNGYLAPSKLNGNDTNAHFENEDLKLFISIDRTGNASATAIPKTKTISVKAFEQTAIYNDVLKKEEAATNAKSELQINTSVAAKHKQKQSSGNISFSFTVIIVLLLACVFIWFARKLTFLGKLFG